MALFKISRGSTANLPLAKNDGYCYFTPDSGKFYIDWDNGTGIQRDPLNAFKADQLSTARNFTIGQATPLPFDGSGSTEMIWTLTEIGAVNRLGDTMLGPLTVPTAFTVKNNSGGNVDLVLDRASNTNWRFHSAAGNLYLQCDYTSSKTSYYNVLTLNYNSGNATFKNRVTATTFIGALSGNATTSSHPYGFSSDNNTFSWGVLGNSSNAYNKIRTWSQNSGEIAFAEKNNQVSVQVDGFFYQNEGNYQVIDTDSIHNSAHLATTTSHGTMSLNDKNKINNTNIAYATCTTAAATAAKEATVTGNPQWQLTVGAIVVVKFGATNTASSCTLNVNGTGAKQIWYNNAAYTSTSNEVCGYANRYTTYMYDGTYWVWISNGVDNNSTYNKLAVEVTTAGATAAKVGTCYRYTLASNRYIYVNIGNANFYPGAITLNINSAGAKPIYINGRASSSSNYTLPDGQYLVYYDGINYYFRTDTYIQGNIAGIATQVKVNNTTSDTNYYIVGSSSTSTDGTALHRAYNTSGSQNTTGVYFNGSTGVLFGAAWNDYAEYRKAESLEAGRVVIEHESGEMKLSTERLMPGAEIISDTFGFAIGQTNTEQTPIAAAGRVLAYPDADRESFSLGAAVCSGPNGTVSLMTREEIREYPERIIGTVSEIPKYETWGQSEVKVNGRIWIRIK